MTFSQSMDEVERMLEEQVRSKYKKTSNSNNTKQLSTLQQSAARRDPSMSHFEFTSPKDLGFNPIDRSGLDDSDDDEEEDEKDGAHEIDPSTLANKIYFGAAAKQGYYKTYHELHGKPQLFVETSKQPPPVKPLRSSSSALNAVMATRRSTNSFELEKGNSQANLELPTPLSRVSSQRGLTSGTERKGTSGADRRSTSNSTRSSTRGLSSRSIVTPSLQPDMPGSSAGSRSTTAAAVAETGSSPRVTFLGACIAKGHPAISIVIRKENCHVFDFSYQGLGNDFIMQFAACLPDLPLVEAINVCGNRLNDEALNALLIALENKPNLTSLDISQNEIGPLSARSLRKYISSSMCTVKVLVLNEADIDDHECALFMNAFEQNKSVEQLLMRSNRIGQSENFGTATISSTAALRTINDGTEEEHSKVGVTGGEAIGEMLNVNLNIQILDLAWNALRISSSAAIANALQLNYNLKELNISYNGCADWGAMVFGQALRTNTKLERLNLAYNSIGAKGGLVLASGLHSNKGLVELILDGNNLGYTSGRCLMNASCTRHATRTICHLSLFDCNVTTIGERAARVTNNDHLGGSDFMHFNPSHPVGEYSLNLSSPYESMIAHELLRLATFKRHYRFGRLEYMLVAGGAKTKIELSRRQAPLTKRRSSNASLDNVGGSPLSRLFAQIDQDGSGTVDRDELFQALRNYGITISEDQIARVLGEYDYDNSGTLEESEFQDFFFRCGFAMIDSDHSGSLNEVEIEKVLKLMGFHDISEREIKSMILQYDMNGSGEIDEDEFIEFMRMELLHKQAVESSSSVSAEGDGEEMYQAVALRDSSGAIWKVPGSGFLNVEFLSDHGEDNDKDDHDEANRLQRQSSSYRSPEKRARLVSTTAFTSMLSSMQGMTQNATEQVDFLKTVLEESDCFLTATQAEQVLVKQGADRSWPRKLNALIRIIPQMVNRREAINLVSRLTDPQKVWSQRQSLKRALGNLYHVMLGSLTNRYSFDLTNELDRIALRKLGEFALEEKKFSKNRAGRNDTSQNGNWENFRNAKIDGSLFLLTTTYIMNTLLSTTTKTTAPSPAESASSLLSTSTSSVRRRAEFDYISTARPPRGTKCMSNRRFDQLVAEMSRDDEEVNESNGAHPDDAMTSEERVHFNAQLRWKIVRNYVFSQSQSKLSQLKGNRLFQVQTTINAIKRKLDQIEMLTCDRWLNCEQALCLVEAMPNAVFARARAASLLFSRIVDIENFMMVSLEAIEPFGDAAC
ncbi:TPA: hypothetical protein N0F65_006675 [Lagenidium giganteum]|uniref:EF-hand domain-containing protein n=1 Tax=Lagenidium giganteum TaxID=4803 RepID=A0AAV2Z5I0_9STRA|nr:TPA: hypothetical protein N0F65_006675 [Lagenidium giganteum]